MERVVKGRAFTLSKTFYIDGVAATPTGTPTVTIVRVSDGTTVAASAVTGTGTGPYQVTVAAAANSLLDTLIVTWTATLSGQIGTYTDTVEVAGDVLFTLAEIRAITPINDTNAYSTADIVDVRTAVEQALEQACGVAFVPRYTYEVVQGGGYKSSLIPTWPKITALRSASIDGSAVTIAGNVLLKPDGTLDYFMGWSSRTAFPYVNAVTVGYEHGYASPPGEIKRAALKLAKAWLVGRRNPIDDRAVTFSSSDGGTYSLAVPGRNGSYFGDPDVDAAIDRYSFDVAVY